MHNYIPLFLTQLLSTINCLNTPEHLLENTVSLKTFSRKLFHHLLIISNVVNNDILLYRSLLYLNYCLLLHLNIFATSSFIIINLFFCMFFFGTVLPPVPILPLHGMDRSISGRFFSSSFFLH